VIELPRPVEIRIYRAKRPEEAARAFQEDAPRLYEQGYEIASQSWADGRSGCLRVLFFGIFALIFKPMGTLTVSYRARPGVDLLELQRKQPETPPALGALSPDGTQYWNGERWLPNS